MKKFIPFFALFSLVMLSLACSSSASTATPTPVSAAAVALTMLGDKVNAEATQSKFESIIQVTAQVEAATATQQAAFAQATQYEQSRIDAQSTADKADAIAQATAQQARRDAQATQQRIDADSTQQAINAQATQQRLDLEATQAQARLDLVATQQGAGTATAGVMTMTAIPPAMTLTQISNNMGIALATDQVELSNLKVKQQRDTNVIQWLVPMLIAIVATIAGVRWATQYFHVREIKNGDGGTDVIIVGNKQMIAPRLFPKPILELESGVMPDVTNPKEQADIVKRDQGIRALEVMPDHPSENAVTAYNSVFPGNAERPMPTIEWATPAQIGNGILEEIEGQVIEEEE